MQASKQSQQNVDEHTITPEEVDPIRDYEFDPTKPWDTIPFLNPNRKLTFVPITASGIHSSKAAQTTMQLDGGASINIISQDLALNLVGKAGINRNGQQCRVQAVGGHVLPTIGSVMLELDIRGRTTAIPEKLTNTPLKYQLYLW